MANPFDGCLLLLILMIFLFSTKRKEKKRNKTDSYCITWPTRKLPDSYCINWSTGGLPTFSLLLQQRSYMYIIYVIYAQEGRVGFLINNFNDYGIRAVSILRDIFTTDSIPNFYLSCSTHYFNGLFRCFILFIFFSWRAIFNFISNHHTQLCICNIANQIPIKLDNTNFLMWKSLFHPILHSHCLEHFIDGSKFAPPREITGSYVNPL